ARDGPLVPFFLVLTDPAAADTYTLSLHAALPISIPAPDPHCVRPIGQRIGRELSRARLERPAVHSTLELDVELVRAEGQARGVGDRKSTRLNSSHVKISYAVFCLKKKTSKTITTN